MTPVSDLSEYRTELSRLVSENHRLRIQLAEQKGVNSTLTGVIDALRKRLDEVHAQYLRQLLHGGVE